MQNSQRPPCRPTGGWQRDAAETLAAPGVSSPPQRAELRTSVCAAARRPHHPTSFHPRAKRAATPPSPPPRPTSKAASASPALIWDKCSTKGAWRLAMPHASRANSTCPRFCTERFSGRGKLQKRSSRPQRYYKRSKSWLEIPTGQTTLFFKNIIHSRNKVHVLMARSNTPYFAGKTTFLQMPFQSSCSLFSCGSDPHLDAPKGDFHVLFVISLLFQCEWAVHWFPPCLEVTQRDWNSLLLQTCSTFKLNYFLQWTTTKKNISVRLHSVQ